jgi:predicted DNA-binding transcriptional regulator YafY
MIQPEVKAKIIEAIQAKKAISFTYQKIDEETGLQYPTSRTINPFVLGRRSEKNLVLGELIGGSTGSGIRSFHPEYMSDIVIEDTSFSSPAKKPDIETWAEIIISVE